MPSKATSEYAAGVKQFTNAMYHNKLVIGTDGVTAIVSITNRESELLPHRATIERSPMRSNQSHESHGHAVHKQGSESSRANAQTRRGTNITHGYVVVAVVGTICGVISFRMCNSHRWYDSAPENMRFRMFSRSLSSWRSSEVPMLDACAPSGVPKVAESETDSSSNDFEAVNTTTR